MTPRESFGRLDTDNSNQNNNDNDLQDLEGMRGSGLGILVGDELGGLVGEYQADAQPLQSMESGGFGEIDMEEPSLADAGYYRGASSVLDNMPTPGDGAYY